MPHETTRPEVLVVTRRSDDLVGVLARAQDEADSRHARLRVIPTAGTGRRPGEAGDLVVVSRAGLGEEQILDSVRCPVLAVDVGAPAGRRTVVAVLHGTARDPDVVRVAVEEALRRGDALLLVLVAQPGSEGSSGGSTLARWERELCDVPGLAVEGVSAPHGAEDPLHSVASASLVVVDRDDAERRHLPRGDVLLVPRDRPGKDPFADDAYRTALERELARCPERRDGARTVEQLDDAWRTNVADPAVSQEVVTSWRASQRPPATWPPRRAASTS